MAQVICISKAGKLVPQFGGVKFFTSPVGRISEEISDALAEEFVKTPTQFRMHEGNPIEEVKKAAPAKRAAPPAEKVTPGSGAPAPGF